MYNRRKFYLPIREDDPSKAGGEAGEKGGGKPADDKGGKPEAPKTLEEAVKLLGAQSAQIETLNAQAAKVDQLTKELATFKQTKDAEEAAELEKKGEYQTLLAKERDKNKALEGSIGAIKRESSIRDAILLSDKDLGYPAAALIKYAKIVDADTDHKLEPDALIERTVEELKKMGLHGNAEAAKHLGGGGGSPRDRQPSNDKRVQQYIDLMKKARLDPSMRDKAIRLGNELRRENIALPRMDMIQ